MAGDFGGKMAWRALLFAVLLDNVICQVGWTETNEDLGKLHMNLLNKYFIC